jgi:hypothetical protein
VRVGDIHRFFQELDRRITRPIEVLLVGGSAAILQGVARATFDIDFEVRPKKKARRSEWETIQRAIDETSLATGITAQYAEDIDRWSSISLPAKQSRIYHRFGKVEVRLLKPALWAIGKLARYLSSDIEDMRIVLRTTKTHPKTVVKLWGTALGISPASSSQSTFRKQVENFLEQYAGEIWGDKADAGALKKLFIETAQAARRSR